MGEPNTADYTHKYSNISDNIGQNNMKLHSQVYFFLFYHTFLLSVSKNFGLDADFRMPVLMVIYYFEFKSISG